MQSQLQCLSWNNLLAHGKRIGKDGKAVPNEPGLLAHPGQTLLRKINDIYFLNYRNNILVFLEIVWLCHHRHDVINRSITFTFIVRCHTASSTSVIVIYTYYILETCIRVKQSKTDSISKWSLLLIR